MCDFFSDNIGIYLLSILFSFLLFQIFREIKTKIWSKTWINLWDAFFTFNLDKYFVNNIRFLLLFIPFFYFSKEEEVLEFKFVYNLFAALFYTILSLFFLFEILC